jgi:hypothetical protein
MIKIEPKDTNSRVFTLDKDHKIIEEGTDTKMVIEKTISRGFSIDDFSVFVSPSKNFITYHKHVN